MSGVEVYNGKNEWGRKKYKRGYIEVKEKKNHEELNTVTETCESQSAVE